MVRFKKRYILFKIELEHGSSGVDAKSLHREIKRSVKTNFGDLGSAHVTHSNIKYFDNITGIGIIRVERDFCRQLWLSLTLICRANGVVCSIATIYTGGSIKSCKRKAIRYHQRLLEQDINMIVQSNKSGVTVSNFRGYIEKVKKDIELIKF